MAACELVDPSSRGGYFDARKLGVLEKFFGQNFVNLNGSVNPGVSNLAYLLEGLLSNDFRDQYAQSMGWHTSIPENIYAAVTYSWDTNTQSLKGELGDVYAALRNEYAQDLAGQVSAANEFRRTVDGFGIRGIFPSPAEIQGTEGNDVLFSFDNAPHSLFGGGGNDTLIAGK